MNTSSLALFSFIALLSFSCLGIGSYVCNKRLQDFCKSTIYTKYIVGLSILYTVFLTGINIQYIVWLVKISGIISIIFFARKIYFKRSSFYFECNNIYSSLFFVLVALIIAQPIIDFIIYEPILDWNARSIWYFRAKQLYFSNGLNNNTGLNTSIFTSTIGHANYPTFMPFLSALIMKEVGFWNEYLPKLNLFIALLGLVLALISLKQGGLIPKILFYFALIAVNPIALKSGSLEVWVGIYTSVGVAHLIDYIYTKDIICVVNGIVTIIFINFFKNDSVLLSFCILIGFFGAYVVFEFRHTIQLVQKLNPIFLVFLIVLCPVVMWLVYLKYLKIPNIILPVKNIFNFNTYNYREYELFLNFFINELKYAKFLIGSVSVTLLSVFYLMLLKRNIKDYKNIMVIFLTCTLSSVLFFVGTCVFYFVSIEGMSWHLKYDAIGIKDYLMFIPIAIFYYVLIDLVEYKDKRFSF